VPIDTEPPDFSTSPVIEAAATDAVVAAATDASGHHQPVHTHCENCGTSLQGPYCHQCGQHDIDFHRSFGHMFLDALENFFHFDAKLFRNIITLLFQPGRLTAEFNAGKRASQMPPFRLYLFVSVLFFFVSFLGKHPAVDGDAAPLIDVPAAQAKSIAARQTFSAALQELARETADPAARQTLQSVASRLQDPEKKISAEELQAVPAGLAQKIRQEIATAEARRNKTNGPGAERIDLKIAGKKATEIERFLTEKGKFALDHQQELQEAFLHALPKMLLLCLPFMALYTRFLFRRSGQVYLQHLIIALHYHTFVYLWWLVASGWNELIGLKSSGLAGLAGFAAGVWMTVYPFLMLRRLFGQSRLRTFFKTLTLSACYGLTLGLGFLLTAIIVFLLA
jgi:hypothetical protein